MQPDLAFEEAVSNSELLGATRSRTEKSRIITELLERAPGQIPVVVGFIVGAPRQGKIGIGYAQIAGIGVAPASEATLTVGDVDRAFSALAAESGEGSAGRRATLLADLFSRATTREQDLIRRLLIGEVRHGALAGLVLDAVSRHGVVDRAVVRRAAMLSGDLGWVSELAIGGRVEELEAIGLSVLTPVLPMLAATAQSVQIAMGSFERASVEWKLDGVRVQVHRDGDDIRIFTRNQNDVTARLPEVVEVARSLPAAVFVLDGEAMSVDPTGNPSPFQDTMSRFGSDTRPDEVPVVPFFFDLLHLDGVDLLDLPMHARHVSLDRLVPAEYLIPRIVTSDVEQAEAFFDAAKALGHEGVMVKDLGSTYEAGRRGSAWLKVKPVHTLDLVVIAAEWGHGRRTGWLSNLHLGARDPDSEQFIMLGKTFKGLTDKMLAWQTERLLELEVSRTGGTVSVRPELVVEVAFDGLLPSPRYPGGLSLRFARVRGYRTDKSADQADTISAVRAIFERRI